MLVPEIKGGRLRLEPLAASHSIGMFALWSAAEVCMHSGPASDLAGREIPLPASTSSDSDRLLEFWLDRAKQETGFRWAVITADENAFVGAVGFNALGACAEYAYHFVPDCWGKGYAAEASRMALAWVFQNGAETVEAFIELENVRSLRLVERLGFSPAETAPGRPPRWILAGPEEPTSSERKRIAIAGLTLDEMKGRIGESPR